VITLVGSTPVTVEVGAGYTDAGATGSDNFYGDVTGSIVTVDPVDANMVGSYSVTYDVVDANGNAATQVVRTVDVVDTTAPVITLVGVSPLFIEGGLSYVDAGATASDNFYGDLTGSIVAVSTVDTNVLGPYAVTYNVVDANGNTATELVRTVTVVDTTVPTITLLGASPQSVVQGDPYVELGATAFDLVDGGVTGSIVIDASAVNTAVAGSYSVTYNVTDAEGNAATEVVRTVNVANLAPLTTEDYVTVLEDTPITIEPLINDTDPEGATLTLTGVDQPNSGSVRSLDSVSFSYEPAPNFFGTVTLTYTTSDPSGNTAEGIVIVEVIPVNDAPEANADTVVIGSYEEMVIDVLANDFDVDGDVLQTVSVAGALHGKAELVDGAMHYTPDVGFVGTDTIVYKVADGQGGSAVGTVTIEVLSAALAAANDLAERVGANALAFAVAPSLFEGEVPVLTLFAGVTLVAESFILTVDALQLPFILLAIALGAAYLFGRSPGVPFLAGNRRRYWSVVMVDRESTLDLHTEPRADSEVIDGLDPTTDAIKSIGRPKIVDGTTWIEIEVGFTSGWVDSDYLTERVDLRTFSEDSRPAELVRQLVAGLTSGTSLQTVLGPRGLTLSANRSLAHVAGSQLIQHDFSVLGDPVGGLMDGDELLASFLSAYGNTLSVTAETRHSSSALIPVSLWNFHYLAIPGLDTDVPWLVYFEYRRGKPSIVALGADW
jgi:hypothetical protein